MCHVTCPFILISIRHLFIYWLQRWSIHHLPSHAGRRCVVSFLWILQETCLRSTMPSFLLNVCPVPSSAVNPFNPNHHTPPPTPPDQHGATDPSITVSSVKLRGPCGVPSQCCYGTAARSRSAGQQVIIYIHLLRCS